MPTATKIYKRLTTDFTVASNEILRYDLSLKAIGLYLYIISKPDGWEFSARAVSSQVKDGRDSVYSGFQELEEAGFLLREQTRKDGKFSSNDWVISDKPISGEKPAESPFTEKPYTGKPFPENPPQVNTNKVNKEKVNTNNIQEQLLPLRGNVSEEQKILDIAQELVDHFKQVFGRTGGGKKVTARNLPYWLEDYTPEEIKQAISNAVHDDFWKDKLTLELLFRKRKPTVEGQEHEYLDRIGGFLAITEPIQVKQLNHMDGWQVANQKKVSWAVIKEKAKQINDLIKSGEYYKKYKDTPAIQTLERWIDWGLSNNKIRNFNEVEELELANQHPKKVAERKKVQELKKKMIQEGEL